MPWKRIAVATFLVLVVVTGAVYAGSARNVHFIDVRALGMGGAGVTTFEDFSAVMYNPAMLARAKFRLDIVNVQLRLGKDVTDMLKFYSDNQEVFDNFLDTTKEEQDKLLDGLAPYDDNWMGFGAYPLLGLTVPNYAVGIYGASDVEFKADKGIFEPRIYIDGVADFVLTGGAAINLSRLLSLGMIPNNLYGGAALKIIKRYEIQELRLSASDADLGTTLDTLIEDSKAGFGLDIGLLYELIPGQVDLGAKVVDLLADIDGEKPPMLVNIGASWRVMKRILLAADWNDFFFHKGENVLNKLNFGGQVDIGSVLAARAGMGQGYPSIGAGLNLGSFALDGAIYGIERGDAPGRDGDYNYAVRLKLGW
ncbi:MAG TPA: hypothetical protein VMY05_02430 [Acidobacteriota bacterium]|nr:hypothetical protein [Acidobacteriota bacterium]